MLHPAWIPAFAGIAGEEAQGKPGETARTFAPLTGAADRSLFSLGACAPTRTRLAALATLSRSAGEGNSGPPLVMLTPMGLRRDEWSPPSNEGLLSGLT